MLRGERVFLNLGTHANVPDVPGLAAATPLTHVEALNLERLPEHLLVIGGGYVGLEFAQAMRRFGSRITIIHRGTQLLDREDPEVASAMLELMKDEGIEVLLQAQVLTCLRPIGQRRNHAGSIRREGNVTGRLRHPGGSRANAEHGSNQRRDSRRRS